MAIRRVYAYEGAFISILGAPFCAQQDVLLSATIGFWGVKIRPLVKQPQPMGGITWPGFGSGFGASGEIYDCRGIR